MQYINHIEMNVKGYINFVSYTTTTEKTTPSYQPCDNDKPLSFCKLNIVIRRGKLISYPSPYNDVINHQRCCQNG